MKVVALGACGEMGRVAARACVASDLIDEVIIADLNEAGAQALAKSLGPKATPHQVDLMDNVALMATLAMGNLVIATVGPYYKFGTLVLNAAIETKTHYIDICDDWEPTLEFLDMQERATRAGITAIVGMGASPGVANLLAVKAIQALDTVESVYTSFGSTSRNEESAADDDSSANAAALDHWVHQFSGTIQAQVDGRRQTVAPLERLDLDYPKYGPVVTYTVGHPEPITLPRYYPSIKDSATVMVMPEFLIAILKDVRDQVDMGKITTQEGAQRLFGVTAKETNMSGADLWRYVFYSAVEMLRGKNYVPTITAFASGTVNGQPARAVAHANGGIGGGIGPETCIPCVVAAEMLIAGEINQHGVFAPEGVVDPDRFFERLLPHFSEVEDPSFGAVQVHMA